MPLGAFQPSVLGMSGQSHALDVISGNIANATTTGYKRTETNFQTVLSRSVSMSSAGPASDGPMSMQSDLGGVRPWDYTRISLAGEYSTTGRDLDLAIEGRGFLVLKTGTGETVYGRDGSLSVTTTAGTGSGSITAEEGYLVDKNGYFVQGWAATADGSFSTGGALTSLRVDPQAFTSIGQATTSASLALNLPAQNEVGDVETYAIDVYDSALNARSLQLAFTKRGSDTWELTATGDTGDVVTLTPLSPGAPVTTVTPPPANPLLFDSNGALQVPSGYAVAVDFADDPATAANDATTAQFTLDLSGFTQFSGNMLAYDYARDGYPTGSLSSIAFNAQGEVVGQFDNSRSRPLYRLALADFANPDGLDPLSGNVYAQSVESGTPALGGAGDNGLGRISPQTLETSNVDLAQEFSRMMLTQNAYNSSATAFRTVDEMTETARDLLR